MRRFTPHFSSSARLTAKLDAAHARVAELEAIELLSQATIKRLQEQNAALLSQNVRLGMEERKAVGCYTACPAFKPVLFDKWKHWLVVEADAP